MLSEAVAETVTVLLTVAPLDGDVKLAVGGVVSSAAPAACEMVKVLPAMVSEPLRLLAVVLA